MENVEPEEIAIEKLIEHGLEANDVRILQNVGINTLNHLIRTETKESLKGLSEAKIDKICEAAEKIMIFPLTKQFIEIVEELLQRTRKLSLADDRFSEILHAYSELFNRCFTLEEMSISMQQRFSIPYTTVKQTIEELLKGMEGQRCFISYMKDSLLLSHFRNAKKNLLTTQEDMVKKIEAMDSKIKLLDESMKASCFTERGAGTNSTTGRASRETHQASRTSENMIEENIKKGFKEVGPAITRTVMEDVENLLTSGFSGLTDKISSTITSELSGERITNDIKAALEPERKGLGEEINESLLNMMCQMKIHFEKSFSEAMM
ncbi:unnamed protein product [Microthlaspi erraticum]|uniref:Uncharacterized protein n=1 Tax=Microthlaspi erraticum TaxID=1685480 RepID=A0A6D2KX73_9BRAS|nr:unnamed protein product [Microthlaspi erraticum]